MKFEMHNPVRRSIPRMDLRRYGTIGIVEFATNSDPSLNSYATLQFQESVKEANPGLPILELGNRATVLAAVGATQFNPETITRIGKKYGVRAVFLGEIAYSQPKPASGRPLRARQPNSKGIGGTGAKPEALGQSGS